MVTFLWETWTLDPVLVGGPSPSLRNTLSLWGVPVTRSPSQGLFHVLVYFFNTHFKYKF